MSSGSGEQVGVASGVQYEPSPDEAIVNELGSWPGANINDKGSKAETSKLACANAAASSHGTERRKNSP